MTHLYVSEWGKVAIGGESGKSFTRAQANALFAAARAHPLGGDDGLGILSDHHTHLRARQMVGVIAADGCSLEILPKVDRDAPEPGKEDQREIRQRLVQMLAIAQGLDIEAGEAARMAQQSESLLDILIRIFAERLLAETRRGLPRAYLPQADDLPALRGRLDVNRQFTINAVRPDRLSCRYDELSSDIALLQVMKACVVFLGRHATAAATRRRLDELRFVLADITTVPPARLAWHAIRIDRSNRRWGVLLAFARLFLKQEWQATHHDAKRENGITLLFAMNDLFEAYVAALAARALQGRGAHSLHIQGGLEYCLTEGNKRLFQTRPDLIVRGTDGPKLIIDTKWKRLHPQIDNAKQGVSQSDVYQMMAYAQLYRCADVMLLYPHHAGLGDAPICRRFTITGDSARRLHFATLDVSADPAATQQALREVLGAVLDQQAEDHSTTG